ncbi:hypothetical protein FNV43_RR25358 [Rhamnella rubrinervis]|uniref:VQ domain-containing protein n=1 Tax=Rhamnella rubrinervis TaxID=2594499 RepID=A0A8K0DNF7_9ROSA|nr:hypothetical protein FNV43_RR25358 [Rhamnella rubrinervis]
MMKNQKQQGKRSSSGRKGVKVVYISTPMKVKTSASEFRALVQELTGRDSDTAGFMETNHVNASYAVDHPHHHHPHMVADDHDRRLQQVFKGVDDYHHRQLGHHEFPWELPTGADHQGTLFQPFDHGDDHFNQLDAFRSGNYRGRSDVPSGGS